MFRSPVFSASIGAIVLTATLLSAACGSSDSRASGTDAASSSAGGQIRLVDELINGYDTEAAHFRREETTAICMLAEGFEYAQAPYDGGQDEIAELVAGREFREEFGYGLSIETDVFSRSTETSGGDDFGAYLAGLTVGERDRFESELDRCLEVAATELAELRSAYVAALPADLQDELQAYAEGTDAALVDIEAVWSDCMAELGYNYGGTLGAYQYLNDELQRVNLTGSTSDREALQQLERQIAVADHDCSVELEDELDARTADLDARLRQSRTTEDLYG